MEEGKIMGYSKKTVYTVLAFVVVAGVMFYAGAKYEKSKLTSLGVKSSTAKSGGTKKAKNNNMQNTTDNTAGSANATTPSDNTNKTPAAPAPTDSNSTDSNSLN